MPNISSYIYRKTARGVHVRSRLEKKPQPKVDRTRGQTFAINTENGKRTRRRRRRREIPEHFHAFDTARCNAVATKLRLNRSERWSIGIRWCLCVCAICWGRVIELQGLMWYISAPNGRKRWTKTSKNGWMRRNFGITSSSEKFEAGRVFVGRHVTRKDKRQVANATAHRNDVLAFGIVRLKVCDLVTAYSCGWI